VTRGRVIALAVIAGGIAFGLLQGEYNAVSHWKIKRQLREAEREVAALQREIDSLAAYADSIESDSATQERVARERFGMLRPGEILYRFDHVEEVTGREERD
jgi:cell division protein FtsB